MYVVRCRGNGIRCHVVFQPFRIILNIIFIKRKEIKVEQVIIKTVILYNDIIVHIFIQTIFNDAYLFLITFGIKVNAVFKKINSETFFHVIRTVPVEDKTLFLQGMYESTCIGVLLEFFFNFFGDTDDVFLQY